MTRFPVVFQSAAAIASVLAISITIAACSADHKLDVPGHKVTDASKLHPIGAELRKARLDVAVTSADPALQSDAYLRVTGFVRHYLRDGRGRLEISSSRGAGRTDALVRSVLRTHGISGERVRFVSRHDGGMGTTLSFYEMAAIAPTHCDDWSEDITRRVDVGPYPNFGCASQRNLANMVADPTDLVTPAAGVDRGSDRMSANYKTYATGTSGAPTPTSTTGK